MSYTQIPGWYLLIVALCENNSMPLWPYEKEDILCLMYK